ncbi:S8 family serine peptidase [Archangium sp.]|uniref:S8 family serine peptidase n=1 Tax=Archangium sp. TaxID=1872627 RepID=UPI00286D693E|nr:S8 family serine peptidase [Archangium sp.]
MNTQRMLPIWMTLVLGATGALGQETNRDFFFSRGQKVFVTVSQDEIGVLSRDKRAAERIEGFAAPMQLQVKREVPGSRLVLLRSPKPLNRNELTALTRDVKRRGEQTIGRAGFVVRAEGSDTPLVVTDRFVVRFKPGTSRQQVDELNRANGVQVVKQNPFIKEQYLLRVTEASSIDALEMANRYHLMKEFVVYSHPNFIMPSEPRETIPTDPLFAEQWHHRNTGQNVGTVDADVDTSLAWDITQGAMGTLIAVIDDGFDMVHPDLTPNFWINPGEIAGNHIDDDGNTFTNDVNGWDFTGCESEDDSGCGDNNPTGDDPHQGIRGHGTAVAGLAAGKGNNGLGVTGTCPNCRLMLLRKPEEPFEYGLAFNYAQAMGAQIINSSWGFPVGTPALDSLLDAIDEAATNGRGGLGSVIFFAMDNLHRNGCTGQNPDISSLENVIAISSATNRDRFDLSGFGNCMELLAPSAYTLARKDGIQNTVASGRGTLDLTSTDLRGPAGFNASVSGLNCPSTGPTPSPGDPNAQDYTHCFMGTSAATPITAGVAGLILTANPGLTRLQVKQLLQDTADKIEDSAGAYSAVTGFSSPATGVATHGWGRVNAFEAVRVVAPTAQGGRGGVDIFFRDNRLDWGNTEQPSNTLFEPTRGHMGHWESMDIKVDAPPHRKAPTAANFDAFTDETPSAIPGRVNRVYVRVRNRGPTPASSVTVKLLWSQLGTALTPLPGDFWTAFPGNSADTTQWHPLDCQGTASPSCTLTQLAYSGSSVATTSSDAARIVQFDFPAPPVNPNLPNHFCLLALADSPEDGIAASSKAGFVVDDITPTDNNVTHRNYFNLVSTSKVRKFSFFIRNPLDKPGRFTLRLQAPQGWKASLTQFGFDEPFTLEPRSEVLVTATIRRPSVQDGQLTILQEQVEPQTSKLLGGLRVGISSKRK